MPNFRSIGPAVEHAGCKQTETDTHTGTTENITSSTNVGGNEYNYGQNLLSQILILRASGTDLENIMFA